MSRIHLLCGLSGFALLVMGASAALGEDPFAVETELGEPSQDPGGPSLIGQAAPGAAGTEAADEKAPESVPIDPPPAPQASGTEGEPVPDADPAPDEATPKQRAISRIVEAQQFIDDGDAESAIQAASEAIALDPENAEAYKKVRAKAYALQGRFEQALADSKPLEVTVAAPQARLMSGRNVVAMVPAGMKLLVDEVRGNWLKVTIAGERDFPWAWISKDAVGVGPQPFAGEFERPLPQRRGFEFGFYYGRPYRPYHDYGRRYYDYWRHVPPRYWRYLPQ